MAVDDLIYVDGYPAPNSKVPVHAVERAGGGLAGTALVAASRLGARAAYCGLLGSDQLSRFTIEEFRREGVDCAPVLYCPEARPIHSIVIVDRSTGQRTIFYSLVRVLEPGPEEIGRELITACRVLFVDHTAGASGLRAVELAQEQGIPVVGDIEDETGHGVAEMMDKVDHLIIGVELAERVTAEVEPVAMVRLLSGAGRACSAVTAGERGCWYSECGREVQHVPAFKVRVADTTGCGDVFHGAYAAAIAHGDSVRVAMRLASAAAALKATQPGGRGGIPSRTQVASLLREHVLCRTAGQ
ncbi:MAG: PfkB family carbohydrate kinase [Anaerolineae bacterium]